MDPITIVIGGGIGFFIMMVIWFALSRYQTVGPNEALIISGRGGTRAVSGGGAVVWPIIQQAKRISLELITLDVETPEVYSVQGVPISVDGVAQVRVSSELAVTAAQQLLSMSMQEIHRVALETLSGHLRGIIGTMTVEDAYRKRDEFSRRVMDEAQPDLANMGLHIVSFTIRNIRDKQGYLDALGKPRIAQVKRDAVIAEAQANRDAAIQSAQAQRDAAIARAEAERDAAIKAAQMQQESQTAQFQAQAKAAEAQAIAQQAKANADIAYELQQKQRLQEVRRAEVQIQLVEKEMQIEVQQKEIERKERELEATVRKPAEAEAYRIERLAQAERQKIIATAMGEAEAKRQIGLAEADAQKARGLAEAEVIRAQGTAEAEAMAKKAEAWSRYNEAAMAQIFAEKLPEIARAISEPLTKIDRMVVISGGGDAGGGASRITQDVVQSIAQIPPVLEALTGVDLRRLIETLPGLRSQQAQRSVNPNPSEEEQKQS